MGSFWVRRCKDWREVKSDIDSAFTAPYVVGTPSPHPQCGQTINDRQLLKGTIRSPTYPGMYPDNIHCHYKLMGERGQRIKLTFIDLDIFSGGEQ